MIYRGICGAILVLCCAAEGIAQDRETCIAEDSIATCYQKKLAAAKPANAKTDVASKAAGEANLGNLAPSIDDFLPKLAAALLMPGIDTSVALRVTSNQSLDRAFWGYIPFAVRFSAELHRPTVYSAILDSVAETRRATVRDRLAKDLAELDDIQISLGINVESAFLGRRYDPHIQAVERLLRLSGSGDQGAALRAMATLISQAQRSEAAGCPAVGESDEEMPLRCIGEGDRAGVIAALGKLASEVVGYSSGYPAWATSSGWSSFADLLNNQPQISFQAGYRPRMRQRADAHSAVGPESWSLRVRAERGGADINEVRSACRRRDMAPSTPGVQPGYTDSEGFDPLCFTQYVRSEEMQSRLKRGARFFVQAEFTRVNKYEAPFVEADSASFGLPAGSLLTAALGYGLYLGSGGDTQDTRVDFAGELTWRLAQHPIHPVRAGTVAVSLTQRLNQSMGLLAGLAWSPNGTFDNSTQRLRFNLGARYKLVPSAQGERGL